MTHPDPTERLAGLRRAMTALGTDQTTPAQRATQTEADTAMAQRIHKTRPGVPLQQVFAVLEALRAAQRVGAAATPPADQTPAAEVRDDLLRTIDQPLAQTLGYQTPEELLTAYDATRTTVDRAGLRDRIAEAIWERQNPGRRYADCEYRWRADADADADAVLAVLPPTDRAAELSEVERQFLTFALDLAAGRMAERPDEFGADDDAAMARLRGLAGEAQQDAVEEPETDGLLRRAATNPAREARQDEAGDTCRSVDVDGEPVRVRGHGDFTEQDAQFFGEVVRAAKRKYEAEHAPALAEDDDPPAACWHTEPGTPCDWDVCRQPERLAAGDRGTDPAGGTR